mmetsp:Transcript_15160/g.28843  ORF Transcript_15160/g.28843 Transcript_15160/m.28843 type:complete len:154 (-) Transcript_15160:457-918(-)
MVAAKHGRFHTVSRLLAEGADPTLKDNFGHDALLHSKHSGCYNTTTILVEVAEAVKAKKALFRDICDLEMLHSSIMYAAWETQFGHLKAVKKIVQDEKEPLDEKDSSSDSWSLQSSLEESKRDQKRNFSDGRNYTDMPCLVEMMKITQYIGIV